jgi:hypothetical protein
LNSWPFIAIVQGWHGCVTHRLEGTLVNPSDRHLVQFSECKRREDPKRSGRKTMHAICCTTHFSAIGRAQAVSLRLGSHPAAASVSQHPKKRTASSTPTNAQGVWLSRIIDRHAPVAEAGGARLGGFSCRVRHTFSHPCGTFPHAVAHLLTSTPTNGCRYDACTYE